MIKPISIISVTFLVVACGGSGSSSSVMTDNSGYAASPDLGAASEIVIDTDSLQVNRDFAFDTAKTIDVDFDLAFARDDDAFVTVCTDYTPVGAEYDVDFNSCAISGKLQQGVFKQSIEITNDKESVVAVVLFQDAEKPPVFNEFSVDDNTRVKADGSTSRTFVWN